jgi:hypothetical protein
VPEASVVIDLDAYRAEADRFMASLDEEFYLHFAGLKPEFVLAPIYERFSDLTTLDTCGRLEAAASGASGGGVTQLWRFACEGYLGNLTRAETEEIARRESSLSMTVDGETIGYRMLRPTLANEADRSRRERLDAARADLSEEHLLPVYRTAAERVREAVHSLGAPTYGELYERFGVRLDGLAAQCRSFLTDTEDLYLATLDRLFHERLGIALADAGNWDVPRLFRATEWDAGFPPGGMLPALEATLGGLGIDLRSQRNVELDLEERPTKSPRAFCAPIEVPGRIMLVIQPMGGPDDWLALFHEAGHTEHFAHTSPSLPLEARRLGDNSVTEGWAALFERLVTNDVWLGRRLDFGGIDEFVAESAARDLFVVRRYCGKLLYELELHGDVDLEEMRSRYVERMTEATAIEPRSVDFLADVDAGFYASCYLRSWALEAQLRAHLRDEFGSAWFARREAGDLLRELWYEGQGMDGDVLADEVTGSTLDLAAVAARIREGLRSPM